VLYHFAADPGRNVRTTLDLGLQRLAEQIVDTSGLPTSLVAIDTRTGAVKASAGNPAAGGSVGLDGRFPPGSTFKIVTATAALENGYTLGTAVNCPSTIDGGGFTFHNNQFRTSLRHFLQHRVRRHRRVVASRRAGESGRVLRLHLALTHGTPAAAA
jgi:cell division protein FtsI/penicillin-binding protein 2